MKKNPIPRVTLEFTPNPYALKFVTDSPLLETGALNFSSIEEAKKGSALAFALFSVPSITNVMIGKNFVSITCAEDVDWDSVHEQAAQKIIQLLQSAQPVIDPQYLSQHLENLKNSQSDVAQRIIQILEDEIRPAVAQDGGDIEFDRYESGIVYLRLQGACAGCPGATMTLKMGVEERLRREIPEIIEVVSV